MTRFIFQGSGQTVGDGGGKVIAVIAGIGALAYLGSRAASGAARMIGEYVVVGAAALLGAAAGVVVTVAVVRLRGRRTTMTAPRPAAQLWHANPQAIPAQRRREIAAPVVNVNIDAGLLAGLMEAARRQPAPVIIPSEAEELPR